MVSFIVVVYIHQKNVLLDDTKLSDVYNKMEMIRPKPTYFYLDSDIVSLIDDIKEYREYNLISFSRMIYAIDTILELVRDIDLGVQSIPDHIQVIIHQKNIAVESLQSVLFKLPPNRKIEYKLERSVYFLQLYLQRHIDRLIIKNDTMIKETGYNTKTKVLYIEEPKPFQI
jgi:hypothetical protein